MAQSIICFMNTIFSISFSPSILGNIYNKNKNCLSLTVTPISSFRNRNLINKSQHLELDVGRRCQKRLPLCGGFCCVPNLEFYSWLYIRYGEGNGTPLQYSCLENPTDGGAWQAAVHGVAKSRTRLSDFPFMFHFHALEKEMATHSSVLAWRIPGTGEPGGLPSMRQHSQTRLKRLSSSSSSSIHQVRVSRHLWLFLTSCLPFSPVILHKPQIIQVRDQYLVLSGAYFIWRRKWQPTPVFMPRESHEQRSLAGYSPWGLKSRTRLSD